MEQVLPTRRFKRNKWRLPILCVSTGLLGLWTVHSSSLWNMFFEPSEPVFSVGQVQRQSGGVRHKPHQSRAWNDVGDAPLAVGQGDALFTGADGRAELKLKDGSLIHLMPNSLVVVNVAIDERNPPSWYSKFLPPRAGSTKLKIGKGNLVIEAKSADIQLEADEKTFKVSPRQSGSVDVSVHPERAGQEVQFAAGEGKEKAKIDEIGASGQAEKPVEVRQDLPEVTALKNAILANPPSLQSKSSEPQNKPQRPTLTNATDPIKKRPILLLPLAFTGILWLIELVNLYRSKEEEQPVRNNLG